MARRKTKTAHDWYLDEDIGNGYAEVTIDAPDAEDEAAGARLYFDRADDLAEWLENPREHRPSHALAGLIRLTLNPSQIAGYLFRLKVPTSVRGTGAGTALLDRVVAIARRKRVVAIYLQVHLDEDERRDTTGGVVTWLTRRGFKTTGVWDDGPVLMMPVPRATGRSR